MHTHMHAYTHTPHIHARTHTHLMHAHTYTRTLKGPHAHSAKRLFFRSFKCTTRTLFPLKLTDPKRERERGERKGEREKVLTDLHLQLSNGRKQQHVLPSGISKEARVQGQGNLAHIGMRRFHAQFQVFSFTCIMVQEEKMLSQSPTQSPFKTAVASGSFTNNYHVN